MIGRIFDGGEVDLLRRAMDGLSARQQAIAENIANIDTPGYQRKDVPFEAALRASLGQDGGLSLERTSPMHLAGAAQAPGGVPPAVPEATPGAHARRNDGNTVDIDTEMTAMVETTVRYSALGQLASMKLRELGDIIGRTV